MAERAAYLLVARSPFHLGERGVGLEESSVTLHADTLFSALCLTLRALGTDLDAFLGRFPRVRMPGSGPPQALAGEEPPPVRLSSAHPFVGDLLLFPRPMLRPLGLTQEGSPDLNKALKKLRYVSKTVLEALLAGEDVASLWSGGQRLQGGQVWVSGAEATGVRASGDAMWKAGRAPRVTVDRVTNRSNVYAAGRVAFAETGGLWFAAEYADPAFRPEMERALRALGDAGIGGERSSGHGQYALRILDGFMVKEPDPNTANGYVSLSLWWPTQDEVRSGMLNGASYNLINRRGWLGSPDGMNLRRRSVRMLAEGAVTRTRPIGALADVTPLPPAPWDGTPHDVWRYGMAFPLRCLITEAENA